MKQVRLFVSSYICNSYSTHINDQMQWLQTCLATQPHIPFSEHTHSYLHSNCPLQLLNSEDEETWDSEDQVTYLTLKLISTRPGNHFSEMYTKLGARCLTLFADLTLAVRSGWLRDLATFSTLCYLRIRSSSIVLPLWTGFGFSICVW